MIELPVRSEPTARPWWSACGRSDRACERRHPAEVEVVEELGADSYVFAAAEVGRLVARCETRARAGARGSGVSSPEGGRGAPVRPRDRRPLV